MMKNGRSFFRMAIVVGVMVSVFGCASNQTSTVFEKDTITQVSSYNGLLASLYDGVVLYSDLEAFGDFGLGTFDKLDGEMVMLDGVLYQVDYDGNVNVMSPDNKTPYVTMVNFDADQEVSLPPNTLRDDVTKQIETIFKNPNALYAIRIDGAFSYIKCRSIPAQEKPYPPLTEIAKTQAIFEKENVKGTVVGFRYPKYAGTMNVPGFHLHFVSDDRTFGGHILDFTTGSGVVAKIDRCTKLFAYIPDNEDARKADFNLDRSEDVKKINRSK